MGTSPGAGKLQSIVRTISRPMITRLWKLELTGFEQLSGHGPAILCPNHISFSDSLFLSSLVPRNISFVGKAEYMDSWKTRHIFPALGMIPIDRGGGSKSAKALELAETVLRRGELFGIYPEGTRSRDGKLHKGRTGAARLAMAIDCPIYPVGIVGTDEIQPPDAMMPNFFRSARITIGAPVHPERYRNRGSSHIACRSMIDEVMFEIRELTGREYVNSYAGEDTDTEPSIEADVATVSNVGDPTNADLATPDLEMAVVVAN